MLRRMWKLMRETKCLGPVSPNTCIMYVAYAVTSYIFHVHFNRRSYWCIHMLAKYHRCPSYPETSVTMHMCVCMVIHIYGSYWRLALFRWVEVYIICPDVNRFTSSSRISCPPLHSYLTRLPDLLESGNIPDSNIPFKFFKRAATLIGRLNTEAIANKNKGTWCL